MKNALLMFGQPRYVRESFPNIHRCLIEPNNPDVFIHMWNDPPQDKPFRVGEGWKNERLTENPVQTVMDLYKPKSILIENQIQFPDDGVDFTHTLACGYAGGAEKPEIAKHYIFATYSMWYSIRRVFQLLWHYGDEEYDNVILTRFDLGIQHPVKLDTYDLNAIWGEGIGRPELLLNWMNFGKATPMNTVFAHMLYGLRSPYERTNIWCNEYWCRERCKEYEIPVKEGNWGLSIPSRNL